MSQAPDDVDGSSSQVDPSPRATFFGALALRRNVAVAATIGSAVAIGVSLSLVFFGPDPAQPTGVYVFVSVIVGLATALFVGFSLTALTAIAVGKSIEAARQQRSEPIDGEDDYRG